MSAEALLNGRAWWVAGAILGGLAVMAGAFGAHGLRPILDARSLEVYQTAVHYQGLHALALLAVALLCERLPGSRACLWSGRAFVAGTLLFSGSLYALALGAPRSLGMITPVGGTLFIIGWGALAWAGFRARQPGGR